MDDIKNVFDHLYEAYVEKLSGDNDVVSEDDFSVTEDTTVKEFCAFCREYLETNTPISMSFQETGVGFQLQDGTHLIFVDQDAASATTEAVVPVTMSTTSNRGMASIQSPNDTIQITDGKGKK